MQLSRQEGFAKRCPCGKVCGAHFRCHLHSNLSAQWVEKGIMDICMLGFLFLRLTARSSRSSCTPGQCARQLSCLCHDSVSNSLFCPGRIARIYRPWGIIMTLIIREKRIKKAHQLQEVTRSPAKSAHPTSLADGAAICSHDRPGRSSSNPALHLWSPAASFLSPRFYTGWVRPMKNKMGQLGIR